VAPARGAPRAFGLNGRGVPAPLWSERAGVVVAVAGTAAIADDGCIVAVDARDGRQRWAWRPVPAGKSPAPRTMAALAGVTAGAGIVVVPTGRTRGGAAGTAAFPVVTGLAGLDARTGRQRWARTVGDDGQALPAVVAAGRVVVSEADGTLMGLAAASGARLWADPPPRGCRPGSGAAGEQGLHPGASVLAGGQLVTVVYRCGDFPEVAGLDPVTGARRWVWRAPDGSVVSAATAAGPVPGMVALLGGGFGQAATAHRGSWPLGPVGYQASQVVALEVASGRPVWQLDGAPASAEVFAGGHRFCVASQFGVECLHPRSGTEAWQWRPAVVPGNGGPASSLGGVTAAAGQLYVVAPASAAGRIDANSTTQRAAPGIFHLRIMDMATGQVTGDLPLPAYYGDPRTAGGVVVSVRLPPGVLAAGAGLVFVDPQLGSSDVVEAFAA
jgi:outer membrane protein assembly factor BamB